MRVRTKVVEKDAFRWFKNGDHPEDYDKNVQGFEKGELREWSGMEARQLGWEGQVVRYFRHPSIDGRTICASCRNTMHVHGWLDDARNGGASHVVCPGDWIIKGVHGEYYPCKPGIFSMSYEPVESPSSPQVTDMPDEKTLPRHVMWAELKRRRLAEDPEYFGPEVKPRTGAAQRIARLVEEHMNSKGWTEEEKDAHVKSFCDYIDSFAEPRTGDKS